MRSSVALLSVLLLALPACGDDTNGSGSASTTDSNSGSSEGEDADADGSSEGMDESSADGVETTDEGMEGGDGDEETATGDGDGDTNPGDGDGDGDTGDGDGDGDTGDGDGDGDGDMCIDPPHEGNVGGMPSYGACLVDSDCAAGEVCMNWLGNTAHNPYCTRPCFSSGACGGPPDGGTPTVTCNLNLGVLGGPDPSAGYCMLNCVIDGMSNMANCPTCMSCEFGVAGIGTYCGWQVNGL